MPGLRAERMGPVSQEKITIRKWVGALPPTVRRIVNAVEVDDIHTHTFWPDCQENGLCLHGVNSLVTYHYLEAESAVTGLVSNAELEEFNTKSAAERADIIYQRLFMDRSPYSVARSGVLTTLSALGLPLGEPNLNKYREYFKDLAYSQYVDTVMEKAGVRSITMTNDPFVPAEADVWLKGLRPDARFKPVLRIDPMFNRWEQAVQTMGQQGFSLENKGAEIDYAATRRYLDNWITIMDPWYMAASLPPTFQYKNSGPENDQSHTTRLLDNVILPGARDHKLGVALMVGVRKGMRLQLRDGGDGVGPADLTGLTNLIGQNPDVRFLVTLLSRENQHELTVMARKFSNLMIFGNWWFLNNPSLIREITLMRMEMLGDHFIPNHSDARVLDQLIYKWDTTRKVVAQCLIERYQSLPGDWPLSETDIERDVKRMFQDNFLEFVGRQP